MSRKTSLDALFGGKAPERLSADNPSAVAPPKLSADNPPVPPPVLGLVRARSGAVRAMGATLDDLKARARSAENVETGSVVAELDTAQIDGSFVADRVSDATDPAMAGLVESMRSGQQVPILVRPHPETPGRYQVAYGHRRVRAAAELGTKVRAVIRPLTDDELVVAQGKENLDRRDLSYIERAFFALRLEMRSFPREVICAAMATDLPNLSRFITVARTIPEDVVAAIGPAPKAGRPRWMDLAERIQSKGRAAIDRLMDDEAFQAMSTDERFAAVLAAVSAKRTGKRKAKPKDWLDGEGRAVARIERADNRFVLTIDEELEPELGDHLMSRFAEILAEHRARKE